MSHARWNKPISCTLNNKSSNPTSLCTLHTRSLPAPPFPVFLFCVGWAAHNKLSSCSEGLDNCVNKPTRQSLDRLHHLLNQHPHTNTLPNTPLSAPIPLSAPTMSLALDFEAFLDPTSDVVGPEYHSFASFGDLDMFGPSMSHVMDQEWATSPMIKEPSIQSTTDGSEMAGSPLDQYDILEAALEASTNSGIFHTPTVVLSKLGKHSPRSSIDDSAFRSPASSSSGHWEDPVTPGLTVRGSVESLSSTMTIPGSALKPMSGNYSWDEASASTLGTSSTSSFPIAHRTTSQPHLGNAQSRLARPMSSMPALREEDDLAFVEQHPEEDYLPVMDESTCYASRIGAVPSSGTSSLENGMEVSDMMTRELHGAFPGYGLGGHDLPQADNIFAAFEQPSYVNMPPQDWSSTLAVGGPSAPDSDFPQVSGSTINPMALMATSDQQLRPATAPTRPVELVQNNQQLSAPPVVMNRR